MCIIDQQEILSTINADCKKEIHHRPNYVILNSIVACCIYEFACGLEFCILIKKKLQIIKQICLNQVGNKRTVLVSFHLKNKITCKSTSKLLLYTHLIHVCLSFATLVRIRCMTYLLITSKK